MAVATQSPCPECGLARPEGASLCPLCGHLFEERSAATRATPAAPTTSAPSSFPLAPREVEVSEPRPLGLREPWFYLALGALTAPILAATPILRFMGWFLSSLTHEMGHSALAWLCGMPSFPAISLAGHAAAVHHDQQLWLVGLIAVALSSALWSRAPERARVPAIAGLLVLYLPLALTPVREPLFLLAGHLGELVFAFVFLGRALTGGFTSTPVERVLHGTVGWYLLGDNVLLTARLVTSHAARARYAGSGSFGLTNDYLRLARESGIPLEGIAVAMTLVALALPALALWVARPGPLR